VHTRWIETEYRNEVPPWTADADEAADGGDGGRQTVIVEVDGKRLEVTLPATLAVGAAQAPGAAAGGRPRRARGQGTASAASGNSLTAPMQGTVIKVAVTEGQQVNAGDLVLVLEAMKMEQPVNAHKAGVITHLAAQPGGALTSGATICEILGD